MSIENKQNLKKNIEKAIVTHEKYYYWKLFFGVFSI